MAPEKDYLGDKLRLVERARENAYFRELDQELIAKMRQQVATQEAQEEDEAHLVTPPFSSILVPVDFSPYAQQALETAAHIAERFEASMVVLHVIDAEIPRSGDYEGTLIKRTDSPVFPLARNLALQGLFHQNWTRS
jgi:K+-sensing histidine kinase KdpD